MVSTNANTASAGIHVVLRTVGRFCLNNFKTSSYIFSKSVTIARHFVLHIALSSLRTLRIALELCNELSFEDYSSL